MISLEDAKKLALKKCKKKGCEIIDIENSLGRVLFESLYSAIDNPPFPRSPYDGFAISSKDIKNASLESPIKLKVIDKIFAGESKNNLLHKDEAVEIMTGAKIPEGADCIIKKEDIKRVENFIEVFNPLNPYQNYCYKGEDFKCGDKVLEKNTFITSSEIMAIASIGVKKIKVYKKPVVGVINTGDELTNPGEKLVSGGIYNSNGYFLNSRLIELGCTPILHPMVCDTKESINSAIKKLENSCDMIITTGGVSVGEKDIVKDCAIDSGFNLLFWKVRIKPGSPLFLAYKENIIFVGLSGTPVACATSFELMVRDLIAYMISSDHISLREKEVVLMDEYNKISNKRRFLRVHISEDNKAYINNIYQTAGQVHTMISSNAILEIKPGESVKRMSKVKVLV